MPGWHGAGTVDVARLDLASWLNRTIGRRTSPATSTFDLDLDLGGHFPRGTYTFKGPHAIYMDYEADDVAARGQLTPTEVLIAERDRHGLWRARCRRTRGSIGIDAPFPYRFAGPDDGVDLRRLPPDVPIPHVESMLAFDYDVHGQFSDRSSPASATSSASQFLGATVGAGTVGTDRHVSAAVPLLRRRRHQRRSTCTASAQGSASAWMQDPRYAGTMAGHFRVDGAGADSATMTLTGGGRLTRADLFGGMLSDADVSSHRRRHVDGRPTTAPRRRQSGARFRRSADRCVADRHRSASIARPRPAHADDVARRLRHQRHADARGRRRFAACSRSTAAR